MSGGWGGRATYGYNAHTIGIERMLHAPKIYSVFSPIALNMTGQRRVSQPFPMDQPIYFCPVSASPQTLLKPSGGVLVC